MLFKKILTYLSWKNIIIGSLGLLIIFPILYSFYLVPFMSTYKNFNPLYTKMMRYRIQQHRLKQETYVPHYTYVPLQKISPYLISAVIYAEDGTFYSNPGVDIGALRNSFSVNLRKHRFALGGSTITMQLCKNLFLSPQKTFFRKYIEIILSLRLHATLSKDRILELYLNVIEWGDNLWGIQNAAQFYFHKNAADLTLEESATLAAIISRPLKYKPGEANPYFADREIPIREYLYYTYKTTTSNQTENQALPTIILQKLQNLTLLTNITENLPTAMPQELETTKDEYETTP